jgi:hypothetical protein
LTLESADEARGLPKPKSSFEHNDHNTRNTYKLNTTNLQLLHSTHNSKDPTSN